jgi:hypothetical protein
MLLVHGEQNNNKTNSVVIFAKETLYAFGTDDEYDDDDDSIINGYFPFVVVDEDYRWNNDTLEIIVVMRHAHASC